MELVTWQVKLPTIRSFHSMLSKQLMVKVVKLLIVAVTAVLAVVVVVVAVLAVVVAMWLVVKVVMEEVMVVVCMLPMLVVILEVEVTSAFFRISVRQQDGRFAKYLRKPVRRKSCTKKNREQESLKAGPKPIVINRVMGAPING